jgi:hypothetical protein
MGQYRKIVILILFHSELQSKDSQHNNCWNGYPKQNPAIEPWFACLTKEGN